MGGFGTLSEWRMGTPTSSIYSTLLELVASLLLVAVPFVTSSFLLLVVRPGAPSTVLPPSMVSMVVQLLGGFPTAENPPSRLAFIPCLGAGRKASPISRHTKTDQDRSCR